MCNLFGTLGLLYCRYREVQHVIIIVTIIIIIVGRDSSVGIGTATGWTVRASNSGGGDIFHARPDRPWGPPSLLYDGYLVSFPAVKRPGRGVDHPPHLVPRLKKEYSYTSTPPLGLHGLFLGDLYLPIDFSSFLLSSDYFSSNP